MCKKALAFQVSVATEFESLLTLPVRSQLFHRHKSFIVSSVKDQVIYI